MRAYSEVSGKLVPKPITRDTHLVSMIANGLNTVTATFSTVEELEESVRSVGWDVDYQQLSKGRYSSEHAFLDGNDISLTSVNFKKRMHITAGGSPEGYVAFLLPRAASGRCDIVWDNPD